MIHRAAVLVLLGLLLSPGAFGQKTPSTGNEDRFTQVYNQSAEPVYQAVLRTMARRYWKLHAIDETNRLLHFRTNPGLRGQKAGTLSVRARAEDKTELVLVMRDAGGGLFGGDGEGFAQALFENVERELQAPSPLTESLVFFMVKEAKKTQEQSGSGEPVGQPPPVVTIQAPMDKVKTALVTKYGGLGFLVLADSTFQLTLGSTQPADSELVSSVMPADARPGTSRIALVFTFTPMGAQVSLVSKIELWTTNISGATDRWDVSSNPSLRADLEKLLSEVKQTSEAQAGSQP
ncbi:MAG: hypothetical protein ACRD2Y_03600 [Terriglobales bacterium]